MANIASEDMVDGLALPAGVHATVLVGRDVVTSERLAYPVVWADRAYDLDREGEVADGRQG